MRVRSLQHRNSTFQRSKGATTCTCTYTAVLRTKNCTGSSVMLGYVQHQIAHEQHRTWQPPTRSQAKKTLQPVLLQHQTRRAVLTVLVQVPVTVRTGGRLGDQRRGWHGMIYFFALRQRRTVGTASKPTWLCPFRTDAKTWYSMGHSTLGSRVS